MSDVAIRVEHLGKMYRIGAEQVRPQGLWPTVKGAALSPFDYLRRVTRPPSDEEVLWALRDVSFEVSSGHVMGIIGRNGAGKSTLLKILSRVTEPTEGRAAINGRVGSLLEVGTGFHPELTGRENVYLNGAILGMARAEIDSKFDEIVTFSGVERFLDTPVKRYSSGMYVRLAFSVAAHLEPEILLVDEVLAVGDLSFQQKCLDHIRGLTRRGMTILLVSHNLAAIQSSCDSAFLLENGRIARSGEPEQVIKSYRDTEQCADLIFPTNNDRTSTSGVSVVGVEMFGEDGISRRDFRFGEAVRIRIEIDAEQRIGCPMINFGIVRGDGVIICNFNNWYDNFRLDYIEGKCSLEGWLPPLRLVPDFYETHVLVWPWGGGHLQGDMTRSVPLAMETFGHFRIHGPSLNAHDGVFQLPALKWRFRRGDHVAEYADMTADSLRQAFGEGRY